MVGLVEVITLLLGLAGFGLAPNPNPPTSNAALHYAIPDADLVVHVDLASIVPANYKTLLALPNHAQIKSSPELLSIVREVVTKVEGGRNVVKAGTGIDLASDITDATAFFQLVPNKDPSFVAVVHGKQLTPVVIDKIAALSSTQAVKVGGGKMVEPGKSEPAIGITKDGVLLAGTPKLVRARLADSWRAPPRGPGTNLAHAAATIDAKPVIAWVVTLSRAARRELAVKVAGGKKNFISDVIARHRAYSGSVFHDGLGWTWIDTTRPGLEQMATVSDGFVELLRASHIAPRAIAKILLGAVDSYRGTNRRVDEIIRRKADLMKIVQTYTGDGNFKVTVNKNPAKLRLDVRATGKTASEVLPAGLLLPGAAIFAFIARGSDSSAPAMPAKQPSIAVPPRVQPAPRPRAPAPRR